MEPITREEFYLAAAAGEDVPVPKPITREEFYLAAAAGEDVPVPEPVTRHDMYMKALINKGGTGSSGGGGDIDALITNTLTEVSSDVTTLRSSAFRDCTSIASVDFPSVSKIGDSAFNGCTALTSVYFPEARHSERNVFTNCTALTEMKNLPTLVTMGDYMFSGCTALANVYLPGVRHASQGAFNGCTALTNVYLPAAEDIKERAFQDCTALTSVDFLDIETIETYAFYNCKSLTALVIRYNAVCALSNTKAFLNCCHILGTVDSTYNPNGDKDGYFYVPAALVDTYKAATNWSTYADRFRALEDYTVDGTITGELDPDKI